MLLSFNVAKVKLLLIGRDNHALLYLSDDFITT